MLGMRSLLAYVAVLLAVIVSTGTSEDIDDTEEFVDENALTDVEEPNYQELLLSLQKARENGFEDIDDKRMAAGWKRDGNMAAGWKRGNSAAAGWKRGQSAAAGWKRPANAAAGWKRGGPAMAGGWKRGQAAAAGWKRGNSAAAGWKRDFEPIQVDTRDNGNYRNNQVKTASGWKRTSRSVNLVQDNEEEEP